jgi:hypothetical protein
MVGDRRAARFVPLCLVSGLMSSRYVESCEMLFFVYLTMLCHLLRFTVLLCVLRKTTKIRSDSCQCADRHWNVRFLIQRGYLGWATEK